MDQANRLRGMIRDRTGDSPHRSGRIIAIASGKGGVGKSIFALNLATELVRRKRHVLLIDADLGMGSLEILSGSSAMWNLSHLLSGARLLDDVIVTTAHGLNLVAGATGQAELDATQREPEHLCEAVADISRTYDDVILDLSAGVWPSVRGLTAIADETILVTTPEPTAIAGAYAFVKAVGDAVGNVNLLVNQAESAELASRVFHRFQVTAAQYAGMTIRNAGALPHDLAVARSVQNRVPFVVSESHSPAAKAMTTIVDRLLQRNAVAECDFAESFASVSPTLAAA